MVCYIRSLHLRRGRFEREKKPERVLLFDFTDRGKLSDACTGQRFSL